MTVPVPGAQAAIAQLVATRREQPWRSGTPPAVSAASCGPDPRAAGSRIPDHELSRRRPNCLLQQIASWLKKKDDALILGTNRAGCCRRALLVVACDGKAKEELTRRLNEANDKLVQCRKEINDLKNEVVQSQAAAGPGDGQPQPGGADRSRDHQPDRFDSRHAPAAPASSKAALDPAQASKIVFQGAPALRQCYERALKKNQALQYQSGVGVTLDVTVQPAGTVEDVERQPVGRLRDDHVHQDRGHALEVPRLRGRAGHDRAEADADADKT